LIFVITCVIYFQNSVSDKNCFRYRRLTGMLTRSDTQIDITDRHAHDFISIQCHGLRGTDKNAKAAGP